ncbi:MAG: RsiV family protein [Armatimonadota bacterium]|nr:RsiV family protein [Armatimonadota bacterium]MDR7485891.1 RsiV family protein [Armatimonadota bacterium]MDR7533158.1 RsiV family protein [Armatimonadota bacterium]MDR7536596.1 RsiV family protein [Armatimonadota bacterium]
MAAAALVAALVAPAGAAASYRTLQTSKPGAYEVLVRYPQFAASTPLARTVNRAVDEWVRSQLRVWTRLFEGPAEGGPPQVQPAAYVAIPRVTFYDPWRLISLHLEIMETTGAGSAYPYLALFTYGWLDGRVAPLVLRDLFVPGAPSRVIVGRQVLRRLREAGAPAVTGGRVTAVPDDVLERFIVEPDGLRYVFLPGVLGPLAAGSFEVKLTLEDLGPLFRRSLLRRD